ncbi:hypothetical protein MMC10_008164 [Thelotrema lepadinum]|nr:hypothetical protein [Thelotrema lepadinum]
MRLRLGLLQDPAVIEKQIQREAKEAAAKKVKAETPTVKTEAQMKVEEATETKEKDKEADRLKKAHQPRIRPLSEAKAIETGANFISETFIFGVALGLLLIERWYSRVKENNRRSDVADKLADLLVRDAELENTIAMMKKELEEVKAGPKGGRWLWNRGSEQKPQQSAKDLGEEQAKSSKTMNATGESQPVLSDPKQVPKASLNEG